MKICMITARFYPYIGGTEIQLLRFARELKKNNIGVFILTYRWHHTLKRFEEIETVPVHRLFVWGRGKLASLTFMFSGLIYLLWHHRKYDILHVHLASSPSLLTLFIGKLYRKPVLVKLAGGRSTGDIATSHRTLIGKIKFWVLCRYINYFIVPTREIQSELKQLKVNLDKIIVIPNGVDTDYFVPETNKLTKRRELGLTERITVIYTGRLEPGKELGLILDVWRTLRTKHPEIPIQLLILGEGSLLTKLKNLCTEYKISDTVHFLGTRTNVRDYLQASDVFVLPSVGEGISNALLEAMSCRLAVLVSNIGGNNEVVDNGKNGIIVNLNDKTAWLESLSHLFRKPELVNRLGILARKTVLDKFSLPQISREYIKFYRTI